MSLRLVFGFHHSTHSMRYCFSVFLLLLCGCSKYPVVAEKPECKLATVTRYGYDDYTLTYDGAKIIKAGNDPITGSSLTYDNNGRLTTVEMPSNSPMYKKVLYYNAEGKVSIEKNYEKRTVNWVESTVLYFTYTNGRVTSIRETVQWASPAMEFEHEVIWDGNNIRSIIIRSGGTTICSQQYSYDLTRKNAVTAFMDLYHVDQLQPRFKMPLYFSSNLLIKRRMIVLLH
ncbi:hypothetical protein [Pollutibacter soli]|uniref:hypothetical protein n=1 Tax=Pollutibacter soli TaxID=3034157 RepID=UPI003013A5EB